MSKRRMDGRKPDDVNGGSVAGKRAPRGRLAREDASRLADEFARLLTEDEAAPKGYVLAIEPRRLVVRDLDDVRATIRTGLSAEDLLRARASLSELARLLGV